MLKFGIMALTIAGCMASGTQLVGTTAYAEQSNMQLAKKTQNPLADLISVPFQNNLNFGLGPHNRAQNVLNIQPIVPFHLTKDLNLITRTIVPIIRQPDLTKNSGNNTFGLGDINTSLFFSPSKPGKVIWGLGPILQFPTATDEVLGTRKWGAGPTGGYNPDTIYGTPVHRNETLGSTIF